MEAVTSTSVLTGILGAVALIILQALLHHVWTISSRVYRPASQFAATSASTIYRPASSRGKLRVLQLNVWSGSDYAGELSARTGFSFGFRDTAAYRERRYAALLREVRRVDPDVMCINESMPCFAFAHRLARDTGMDCVASLGIAGLQFGWLRFPFISEGDAVLAKRALDLQYLGRHRLSGGVCSSSISFNTGDATQVLGCRIRVPTKDAGETREVTICATHWQSTVVDDAPTRAHLKRMTVRSTAQPPRTQGERERQGQAAIARGSLQRVQEALDTARFVTRMAGDTPTILAGDLNSVVGTPEMRIMAAHYFYSADEDLNDAAAAAAVGETGVSQGCTATSASNGGYTWDPANPNVAMQNEKKAERRRERGSVGESVEAALYDAFEARPSKLDHVLMREAGGKDGRGKKLGGDAGDRALTAERASIVMRGGGRGAEKGRKGGKGGKGGKSGGDDEEGVVPSDHYGILVEFNVA